MNNATRVLMCFFLLMISPTILTFAHHQHSTQPGLLAESGLPYSGALLQQPQVQSSSSSRAYGVYKGVAAFSSTNQTPTTTPILPENQLPFTVEIKQAPFVLPFGIQSGAYGTYNDFWIFIAGNLAGLHGFSSDPFPVSNQNTSIFVVNAKTGKSYSRSLKDPSLGLTAKQVEYLSVISPEFFQASDTLYIAGGYGYDAEKQSFNTKPVFSAIDLKSIVDWVIQSSHAKRNLTHSIRQIKDPIFQVTGGEMFRSGDVFLLIFGQNFDGVYTTSSNGNYSRQIRRFRISESNGQIILHKLSRIPTKPKAIYRRRDLNILPVLLNRNNRAEYGYVAYSGVFTTNGGIWTVPVVIDQDGTPNMADPNLDSTFKQGMNNYACAAANLYSKRNASNYNILFGGISFGFFAGGVFQTDSEIPFINQVTTIKMDSNRHFTQYLMQSEYPPVNDTPHHQFNGPMLFGAGAYFIPSRILKYANGVISLDSIRRPTIIGHIVGGIQSSSPNVMFASTETKASRFVFEVRIIPRS